MKDSKINNLKQIRKSRGFTAKSLAKATGLSINTIQSLELDRVDLNEIKLSTLRKLCLVLETTPYLLFKDKCFCEDLLGFSKVSYKTANLKNKETVVNMIDNPSAHV